MVSAVRCRGVMGHRHQVSDALTIRSGTMSSSSHSILYGGHEKALLPLSSLKPRSRRDETSNHYSPPSEPYLLRANVPPQPPQGG